MKETGLFFLYLLACLLLGVLLALRLPRIPFAHPHDDRTFSSISVASPLLVTVISADGDLPCITSPKSCTVSARPIRGPVPADARVADTSRHNVKAAIFFVIVNILSRAKWPA